MDLAEGRLVDLGDTLVDELGTGGGDVPDEVHAKASALDAARADKNYAAADAIRAELQADGWTVETTKDGTTVRR